MVLNVACYGNIKHDNILKIIDFILKTQMADGSWNCRLGDKPQAINKAHEFILIHKLYKSDKTGQVIDKKMTMLSYSPRWRYDILRILDYFQSIDFLYDTSIEKALNLLLKKKIKNSKWALQQKYPGRVFFDFEKSRKRKYN
jgi:hypothetical protein